MEVQGGIIDYSIVCDNSASNMCNQEGIKDLNWEVVEGQG